MPPDSFPRSRTTSACTLHVMAAQTTCSRSTARTAPPLATRLCSLLEHLRGARHHILEELLARLAGDEAAAVLGEHLEDLQPLPLELVLALHLEAGRRVVLGAGRGDERLAVVLRSAQLGLALDDGGVGHLRYLDLALLALDLHALADLLGLLHALRLGHLQVAHRLRDAHVHVGLGLHLLHARLADHLVDDLLVLDLVPRALREQVLLLARVGAQHLLRVGVRVGA
eukprot:scaffold77315_cov72-Phaeocystis_antarctica.AAC.3